MPKLRNPEAGNPEHLSAKMPAGTLARLDALGDGDRSRGARTAIVAGLDALEGAPPGAPGPVSLDPAPLDVNAVAGALYDRLGPMVADAVAEGARRARRPELAPVGVVGVARVVDSLRAAFEAAEKEADREARARLDLAVIEAINILAYGEPAGPVAPDPDAAAPVPTVQADRRTPPPKPRPGGKRKAPVADPDDRRAPDRLTGADVGRWVAESDDGRYRAHKLARIGGGGAAECACGESVDLRLARLAAEGRRRCSKCEGA